MRDINTAKIDLTISLAEAKDLVEFLSTVNFAPIYVDRFCNNLQKRIDEITEFEDWLNASL